MDEGVSNLGRSRGVTILTRFTVVSKHMSEPTEMGWEGLRKLGFSLPSEKRECIKFLPSKGCGHKWEKGHTNSHR